MNNITQDRVRRNTSDNINQQIDKKITQQLELAKQNPASINERISKLNKEWDIERLLETNASTIAFIGVLLGFFVHKYWLILPMFVLIFLFQHAVQGWCPPIPIFRRLNVRTQKEIDKEIYALKVLRGDFENVDSTSPDQIMTAIEK